MTPLPLAADLSLASIAAAATAGGAAAVADAAGQIAQPAAPSVPAGVVRTRNELLLIRPRSAPTAAKEKKA